MNIEQPAKRLGRAGLNQSSFVRRKAAEVIDYYSTELAWKGLGHLTGPDTDLEVRQAAKDVLGRLKLKKK